MIPRRLQALLVAPTVVLLAVLAGWPLLLMPAHIALLELLIDPACSVVFEAEPAAAGLMRRPPRGAAASPFAAANLWRGVAQGVGLALLLLAGHALLLRWGLPEAQARSVVFAGLVLDVWLLTWTNSSRGSAPAGAERNPWLPRLAAAVALALVGVMAVPPLRRLMGLAWPEPSALAALAVLAAAGVAWLQLMRRMGAQSA